MSREKIVLLIEDNPNDIDLMALECREQNAPFRLKVARDGAEALAMLDSGFDVLPDLLVLDLKLPKMDGFELLRRLREKPSTRHLPVVIFSSSDQDRDQLEASYLGAKLFLQKPMDMTEFRGVVKQLSELVVNGE